MLKHCGAKALLPELGKQCNINDHEVLRGFIQIEPAARLLFKQENVKTGVFKSGDIIAVLELELLV